MIKLSKSHLFSLLGNVLLIIVFAKSLAMVLWWYLPNESVELQEKDKYRIKYQVRDFKNMLKNTIIVKTKMGKSSLNNTNITNMVLKGLYGSGLNGFIIVALKKSIKKTSVIAVGEVFFGFKLKSILKNNVVFRKNNKDYILKIEGLNKKQNKSFVNIIRN